MPSAESHGAEPPRATWRPRARTVAVRDPRAGVRLAVCFAAGVVVASALAVTGLAVIAAQGGWDVAAVLYLAWTWAQIGPADSRRTAALAMREDTSRPMADLVLLLAAVASLGGVGAIIMLGSGSDDPVGRGPAIALAIGSVMVSWAVVHTGFTVRYARLYYLGGGGIDFNQPEAPRYLDFAYLAFTLGMTFQVSDTDLQTTEIRATALRHALISYLFGAVIIAVTINLVAGLSK